jgi:predicted ATPase
VRQEIQLAWRYERPIVPLLLEPITFPDDLAYWLEGHQWVEVLDRHAGAWLPDVLRALEQACIVISQATAPGGASTVPGTTTMLPTSLTELLGRETELREVAALLAVHRLVTLTGPGGVGKTRLAIEVARAISHSYPGGSWFVDLAPIADPALVMPTIARSLGLWDAGDEAAGESITLFLHGKRALLVLDNFERIVAAAPALVPLLATSPELTMLITSRTRLRISGEHHYPVPSLSLPDAENASTSPEAAASVQLFVQRAQAVQPAFQIDPDTAAAVSAICRRLDGLPLAIELAAARVTMFSPVALLKRLEQHMAVLTGGARDLPERQRTMRNAIAWSYELLSPDEQALLRRLCVFVGGFRFEAAEAVGSIEHPVRDVLLALTGLIDQSLVRRLASEAGESRFGVLETVREFGLEHLAAAQEESLARAALVAWAIELMERAATGFLDYSRQAPWFAVMDAELGNLRTAIDWMTTNGQHLDVLRLLESTDWYWAQRPFDAEVLRWLKVALEGDTSATPPIRSGALHLAALAASWLEQPLAAMAYAEEGVEIGRATGDPFILGRALYNLGIALEYQDKPEAALAMYAQGLPHMRESGQSVWVALILSELGDKHVVLGSAERAIPFFDEALVLMRRERSERGIALVQSERAFAALALGRPIDAAHLFAESFRSSQELGDDRTRQGAAAGLAGVALALGRPEHAAIMLGAVEAARVATGLVRPLHVFHSNLVRERVRSQLGEDAFLAAVNRGHSSLLHDVVADVMSLVQDEERPLDPPRRADPNALTP